MEKAENWHNRMKAINNIRITSETKVGWVTSLLIGLFQSFQHQTGSNL